MIMTKRKSLIVFIVILQLFTQLLNVECRPKAKKGKGKAFGAGILAGGLAGAAMGHLLTRQNNPAEVHHHHHITDPNAAASNPIPVPRPSTIIERGETLANGCYKQIIKEPNVYDMTTFIETEQLICPPSNVPAAPSYAQQIPAAPVVPVTQAQPQPILPVVPMNPPPVSTSPQIIPAAPENIFLPHAPADMAPNTAAPVVPVTQAQAQPIIPAVPMNPLPVSTSQQVIPAAPENVFLPHAPADMTPNTESRHTDSLLPVPPTPLEAQQKHDTAPIVPIIQQHLPQPVQPAVPIIVPPTAAIPGQVIVLSKKTGFYAEDKMKKNLASNLLTTNFGIMLLIAGLLYFI